MKGFNQTFRSISRLVPVTLYQVTCVAVLCVGVSVCFGCSGTQSTPQGLRAEPVAVPSLIKDDAVSAGGSSVGSVRDSNQLARLDRLKPSLTEICNSDVLLLSVYEFDRLYGSPLPKECCTNAIKLKSAWQCEHDWPSSDVPTCESLTGLAKRLYGFADGKPSWFTPAHNRRVMVNAGRLQSMAVSKGGCTP